MPATLVAFVVAPDGRAALVPSGPGRPETGPLAAVVARAVELESADDVRWVWWSAGADARALASAGLPVSRCWDVAEAHRHLAD